MISALLSLVPLVAPTDTPLAALDLSRWQQSFSRPQPNRSVIQREMRVAGVAFARGLGVHAPSAGRYALGGRAESIAGQVGVDDGGGGSMVFQVWADGAPRWTSRVLRRGQTEPFEVSLRGAREMTLLLNDARDGSGGDHGNWIDVVVRHTGPAPTPLPMLRTLTVHPDRLRQTIDNFAASDSWTVEPLKNWPEARRREIAKLLFDTKRGAGLSGWRHNLGGGLNHETINMPYRTVETYEVAEGKYDFSRNPGKKWMLRAAHAAGVRRFVAYAITPPRRLTRNGMTNGTDGQGSTNLVAGGEPAFARYLADILAHYRSEGIEITHLSPVNEPDFEWNAGSQEGNRASNADIMAITRAIRAELDRQGLATRILTPEANSPQIGVSKNDGMSRKYGAEYGNYTAMFREQNEWRKTVNPIYGYHSYWADGPAQLYTNRRRLRDELDKIPGLEVWQTEYCQMAGPRGEGGWGRDLGMTLALNVARILHFDLTTVEASAWQWWLAVSDSDYKDGLIYVDDLDRPDGTIYPSKTLWAIGHFARFVRPGWRRIETEGPFEDIGGVLPSAFRDPRTGRLAVVLVNTETQSERVRLAVLGRWKAQGWITSDRPNEDLAPMPTPNLEEFTVPSRSIVTVVLTPDR